MFSRKEISRNSTRLRAAVRSGGRTTLGSLCQDLSANAVEVVTDAPELTTSTTTEAAAVDAGPVVVAAGSKKVDDAAGCDRSSISGRSW